MTVRDDLIAARALIDTPDTWCHGGPGKMQNGHIARCIFIALGEVNIGPRRLAAAKALSSAIPWRWLPRVWRAHADDERIIWLNDAPATTHADIMALFDRAIEKETADARH